MSNLIPDQIRENLGLIFVGKNPSIRLLIDCLKVSSFVGIISLKLVYY